MRRHGTVRAVRIVPRGHYVPVVLLRPLIRYGRLQPLAGRVIRIVRGDGDPWTAQVALGERLKLVAVCQVAWISRGECIRAVVRVPDDPADRETPVSARDIRVVPGQDVGGRDLASGSYPAPVLVIETVGYH